MLSGAFVVALFELGIMGMILVTPEGVGLSPLPLLDLLVFTLVIAASLLPIWWSLSIALLNCLFMTLIFIWTAHAPEFALHQISLSIIGIPLLLQCVLFCIAFL